MHDLTPLRLASPTDLDWERATIPTKALTGYSVLRIKVRPEQISKLVSVFGFAEPGQIAGCSTIESLWIGPGDWLLVATAVSAEQVARLERLAANHGAGIVDASAQLTIIELATTGDVLARLTGLPRECLALGRVARTRLADIPVTIAVGPVERVRLLFDRTYAPHVRAWLDRAI